MIDPPVVAKTFGANSILTNGTTKLNFSIEQPKRHRRTYLGAVFFVGGGVLYPARWLLVGYPREPRAPSLCNPGGLHRPPLELPLASRSAAAPCLRAQPVTSRLM